MKYRKIHEPWAAHVSLQHLCEHIDQAPYASLIFGATSMHTLLVGQHETLEWNTNMLRVEALEANRITLEFHAKEFIEPSASTCTPEALIDTFERFIHRLKWVSDTK